MQYPTRLPFDESGPACDTFSPMQISIYLTADNITRYDAWWIDSPVFNYSAQAFLY